MRRKSRAPIQSNLALLSHVSACGVIAGEGSRRCSLITGSSRVVIETVCIDFALRKMEALEDAAPPLFICGV
jgi:hypothetical protein